MTPNDIISLRCHLGRFAQVANAAGAPFTLPGDGLDIDDALVQAVSDAGGYLFTMWEIPTLYGTGTWADFNAAYDELGAFLDDPSVQTLDQYGVSAARLFASVATYKGVPASCGDEDLLALPGLVPPDPTLQPPEKVREPPRPNAPTPSRAYAAVLLGAVAALGGVMWWRGRHGKPLLPGV